MQVSQLVPRRASCLLACSTARWCAVLIGLRQHCACCNVPWHTFNCLFLPFLCQVIEPKVKAFLYTWGEGRYTAEGARVQAEPRPASQQGAAVRLLLLLWAAQFRMLPAVPPAVHAWDP